MLRAIFGRKPSAFAAGASDEQLAKALDRTPGSAYALLERRTSKWLGR